MSEQYDKARGYVEKCELERRQRQDQRRSTFALAIILFIVVAVVLVIWRVQEAIDRANDRRHHDTHPTLEVRP